MILKDLLQRIQVLETIGTLALSEVEVSELVFDSRKVVEDSLYVALKGTVSDGHAYINSSIEKGAKVIVCEELPSEIKINRRHRNQRKNDRDNFVIRYFQNFGLSIRFDFHC